MTPATINGDHNAESIRLSEPADSNQSYALAWPPFSIPEGQRYYWSPDWLAGERETLKEIEAGEFTDFNGDDPEDVVRWLSAE